jgi:hypothetical protein
VSKLTPFIKLEVYQELGIEKDSETACTFLLENYITNFKKLKKYFMQKSKKRDLGQ